MKILLIDVSIAKSVSEVGSKYKAHKSYPSLGLAILAALTPKEYEVTIIDDSKDEVNYDMDVDLVGLTSFTAAAVRAYQIADRFRERGVSVVMGGVHATAVPEEAILHCDAVAIGEAEITWGQILQDFKNGELKEFYKQEDFVDMSLVPRPRRDLIDSKGYITTNVIQATRGCPLDCVFCSVMDVFGKKVRYQPVENVIADIKSMDDRIIVFTDDNIAINPKYTKELFTQMIPLKRMWVGEASWTIGKNDEILELARQSGCIAFLIGLESIKQQDNVKKLSKEEDMRDVYLKSIKNIQKHGISVLGAFIFGFDNDDMGGFDETINFIKKANLDFVQISSLTPFPGTELFRQLEKENRILTRWREYTYDPPGRSLVYKNLTHQELKEGIKKVYENFYLWKKLPGNFLKVWKRTNKIKAAVYYVLAYINFRLNMRNN